MESLLQTDCSHHSMRLLFAPFFLANQALLDILGGRTLATCRCVAAPFWANSPQVLCSQSQLPFATTSLFGFGHLSFSVSVHDKSQSERNTRPLKFSPGKPYQYILFLHLSLPLPHHQRNKRGFHQDENCKIPCRCTTHLGHLAQTTKRMSTLKGKIEISRAG